ncbi:hypothetical protein BSKO_03753 [Bryopsis sp. KO-2023]|nr:hypothetical protein BSKO_03753 [Bryopsis sp. KO-2023]
MASFLLGLLDILYNALNKIKWDARNRFFNKGFGDLDNADRSLSAVLKHARKESSLEPVALDWTSKITEQQEKGLKLGAAVVDDVEFDSPLAEFLPLESKRGYVQFVRPANVPLSSLKGIVIHIAATNDNTFAARRRWVADPLLRKGIASMLLMNATYGPRQPKDQWRSYPNTVSEYLVSLLANMVEAAGLVGAVRKEFPDIPVGLTGISLGGSVASWATCICDGPLAVSPCVGADSPVALLSGILSKDVAWDVLLKETEMSKAAAHKKLSDLFARWGMISQCIKNGVVREGDRVVAYAGAVDDHYVRKHENETAFENLKVIVGEGNVERKWIAGGHVWAIGLSRWFFVPMVLRSFELLRKRM